MFSATPDYSMLPAATPAGVRHVIRHCLEKDRRRRLKHIGDARLDLDDAAVHAAADSESSPVPPAAAAATPRTRSVWGAAMLAAVALAAGTAAGALWLAPRSGPSPVVRTIIPVDILAITSDRSFDFTTDGGSLGADLAYYTRSTR